MFSNQHIEQIYDRMKVMLIKTPCIISPFLSELTKARVYLKFENMQRTGSFKERGALNFLIGRRDTRLKHVVTASAGNHAQAVALHSARLNILATVFMPLNTSNIKILETERLNAQVKLVGENYDEAYIKAQEFAQASNAYYLHAYNDPHVIAGQATVALEIYSQIDHFDAIFIPVGGGGLLAGIAQFIENTKQTSKPKIFGVEACDFQSMAQVLKKGKSDIKADAKTIAEGIAVRKIGELAQRICEKIPLELVSVTDQEIQAAIMLLLERQKIISEGAGAVSTAALLSDKYRHSFKGKTVVLVVSGGNIDVSLLAKLTAQELVKTRRLCRMSLIIKDTPGSLAKPLEIITNFLGNIIDIRHERLFANIRWNEVLVEVIVETKNENHENNMILALKRAGYMVNANTWEIARG
jgi:threonine dehydratase